jgi:hypothetical protein
MHNLINERYAEVLPCTVMWRPCWYEDGVLVQRSTPLSYRQILTINYQYSKPGSLVILLWVAIKNWDFCFCFCWYLFVTRPKRWRGMCPEIWVEKVIVDQEFCYFFKSFKSIVEIVLLYFVGDVVDKQYIWITFEDQWN